MGEERDVCPGCGGHERLRPRRDGGGHWRRECDEEQHESDRADLAERLEVEAVSVEDVSADRSLLEPVLAVRAGA
jgi:hypothetical protein